MLKKWLQRAMSRRFQRQRAATGRRGAIQPFLEELEDRMAPATFTVTNSTDPASPTVGDGSLREAIIQANAATPGPNLIVFNIPAPRGTVETINVVGSPLPAITTPVTIDGLSEGSFQHDGSSYSWPPLVVLNGSGAGAGANGLVIANIAGCTIDGLAIDNFSSNGIVITGGSATGNTVFGNELGTDASGTVAEPNGSGIALELGASNNTIGGTTIAAGNLISGNTDLGVIILDSGTAGNVVEGNLIGTSAAGTVGLPNNVGVAIEFGASNNTIGGTTGGAGNVISGNNSVGVNLQNAGTTGNLLQGNFIGTDFTGMVAVANKSLGVAIGAGASNNLIGGTATGASNVISGNSSDGMNISGSGTTGNVVEGNLIGTSADGTAAVPNSVGIVIQTGASGNTIGGTAAGAGNVISGNSADVFRADGEDVADGVDILDSATTGNVVEGNFIGTNAAGTAALGNAGDGVFINASSSNTIGGTTAAARNIISGNGTPSTFGRGVDIESGATDNVIEGNYIGTDVTGAVALGNQGDGVTVGDVLDAGGLRARATR
jgi:hypothetical protein